MKTFFSVLLSAGFAYCVATMTGFNVQPSDNIFFSLIVYSMNGLVCFFALVSTYNLFRTKERNSFIEFAFKHMPSPRPLSLNESIAVSLFPLLIATLYLQGHWYGSAAIWLAFIAGVTTFQSRTRKWLTSESLDEYIKELYKKFTQSNKNQTFEEFLEESHIILKKRNK